MLCLLGLLLFSVMLILLVAGFVSHSSSRVINSFLTVINMTGVANLVISMALALEQSTAGGPGRSGASGSGPDRQRSPLAELFFSCSSSFSRGCREEDQSGARRR